MGQLAAAMKCNSCNNRNLMSDMRYSRYSDSLVCLNCFESHKKGGKALKAVKKPVQQEQDPLAKYKCSACGYRFSRKLSIDFGSVCPYCSRESAARISGNEAQQLIRESQFIEYY